MENYKNSEDSSNEQSSFDKEEAYLRAKKRFDKLKGFYWHLASYVVVNIFLIVSIWSNLDKDESIWELKYFVTAFFWGIGLAFHAMGVFGTDLLFGRDWEKRKIEEFMNKDKRNWE